MSLAYRQSAEEPARLALEDFDYDLPARLIAQVPAPRRDEARLLVLHRASGALSHSRIDRLVAWLRPGDLLVFNDARVVPARLHGETEEGGRIELLLLSELPGGMWECLGKPVRRLRPGRKLFFPSESGAEVIEARGGGRYAVRFADAAGVRSLLDRHGEVPLPPYIKRPDGPLPLDRERYQSVFAKAEGAVAAPTASLHFTPELLAALREAGVLTEWLTLHVGPATFLPPRDAGGAVRSVEPERAFVPAAAAEAVRRAKAERRRVVAVGTTTVRALESAASEDEVLHDGDVRADAFIAPGFRFRVVDALLTNFHLPRSTLLMLVSALAGRERVLAAYAVAVAEGYRFYSYGDAMLVV